MVESNCAGRGDGDRTPMTGIDRWAVAAIGCDASDTIINLMKSRRIMGFVPVPMTTPNVEPYRSSKRSGLHVHGNLLMSAPGVIHVIPAIPACPVSAESGATRSGTRCRPTSAPGCPAAPQKRGVGPVCRACPLGPQPRAARASGRAFLGA